MRISRFVLLAASLLLISCSRKDPSSLYLVSPIPKGVVAQNAVFEFSFSRSVVSPDSVNMWTTAAFVEFTPPIEGKFVWQDTARLIFSPDQPLPGDRKFKAKLNTSLLATMAHARRFAGDDEFEFSTEWFSLRTAEFYYDRIDNKRTIGVHANLEFTYEVNPEDLAKYLRLSIDGKNYTAFKVASTSRNKFMAVEIGSLQQFDKPRDISVDFDSDFESPETNTNISMSKAFLFKLPPIDELKILGHAFEFDGKESRIRVQTSQEVDVNALKSFVQITPERSYKLEVDGKTGFTLRGDFEPGTPFKLTVKQGLESYLGGRLQNEYLADIIIGNVKPSFRFASSSGVYMLLAGQKTLEVKTVNLAELNVRVSQIFQNNLVHFLTHGRGYDYYYEYNDDEEGGGGWQRTRHKYRYEVGTYGRVLSDSKIAIQNPANREASNYVDLAPSIRTDYKGFYLVEIANPTERWRSTAKLISMSDLGLMVKRSEREVRVFVVSLETNKPESGVTVNLISTNNQTMATQRTDGDGAVVFSDFADLSKDFSLKLITAEKGDDFNFINLEDYRVETSRFDVGGKRDEGGAYDAFLYGDRNIYRPGETVMVTGIVRNLTHELPKSMPVRIKVYNPRGAMVQELRRDLNEQGSFEIGYPTQLTTPTGEYRFSLHTGDDLFLASYVISVEDFVPDRMRVTLKASKEAAVGGDRISYDLLAVNFFGPPAADRKFEFEGTFETIPYSSKAFPDFRFADDGAPEFKFEPYVVEGTTDQHGSAAIQFDVPKNVAAAGLLRAKGRVAVFDESGRPVYQIARTTIYPRNYYIGIKNPNPYYISPNTPMKIQLVAVDATDKVLKGFKAKVDVVRREWHTVLRMHQQSNSLRYVSEQTEIVESSQIIVLADKPTECTYVVRQSGDYIVRVSKADDRGFNQFSFYAYSWGTTDATSFEVDPEARVDIVFDKKSYEPGETARVLFQTPFSGTMLVTVERNKVFRYHYIDVEKNSASLEIPIENEFLPNVYVSAVLFRKIKDNNLPLLAGHGFVPLMVERKANRLDVRIDAPEKIRPRTKQTITVSVPQEKEVVVTLAAVDEGICQVKNFATPNPYGYFYTKKALETQTFDFFRDLLPEAQRPKQKSSSGGGDDAMAQRANPLGVQRFKPVALWSGIVKTNGDGTVRVTFDVPEFNGELRLMAIAYKGDHFGSVQQAMKVADPIVITPALPRFLSPNDQITMPITAFNTTDKPVKLNFIIETEGGITAVQNTAMLDLNANQERFVNVSLKATDEIGKAVVRVMTTAFGEKYRSTTELSVRPTSGYVTESETGFLDAGKTVTQDIPDVFLPYGRRGHIFVSPFPVANFAKELKQLVGYPHGCLEQTTSKAFPQIYLRDIALLLDPTILEHGSPSYFVSEAITKITSMQMNDGLFSYWPGGDYSNSWSSVYATHFLVEAKKAGYAVPEGTLNAALSALRRVARDKQTFDYYCWEGNRTVVKRVADKSAVYALYILSLAGQPEQSVMNFYRTARALLTTDTQYLLAGAFALSGDRSAYLELLPPQFVSEEAARTAGMYFDSPIRANAIILNVLLETDPNNVNIARYMEYLSSRYRRDYWYSTQDNAFTLLAFGKAARRAGTGKVKGTIQIGGKTFSYDGGSKKFPIEQFGTKLTLNVSGEGRVYYSIVTEGIRKDGAMRIEDKNLRVRREFFDRFGNGVNLDGIKQNSLLIVKLTAASDVSYLENVAITDLLPAGFEIDNPRLSESSQYAFIKGNDRPVYVDIRDDRINYYVNFANDNSKTFYYLVRAVTKGEFQYAPVVGEAMYDGNYYSAFGGRKVRVVE